MEIIYPPTQTSDRGVIEASIVFLAGPIKNAPNWQDKAVEMLAKRQSDFNVRKRVVVANPRTEGKWHGDYNGQVDWELKHLQLASQTGVIVFWLALPNPTLEMSHEELGLMLGYDSQRPTRAYAQTSRVELGEWIGFSRQWSKAPFILGIEPGFTGERYIKRRLHHLRNEEIPDTLERTIELAAERLA